MTHYYNTNHETGDTLVQSEAKAARQEDVILEFFREHLCMPLSPEDVHVALTHEGKISYHVPLTSVRRAITNLHGTGYLTRTPTMKMGTWGKYIHTYRYNPGRPTNIDEYEQ